MEETGYVVWDLSKIAGKGIILKKKEIREGILFDKYVVDDSALNIREVTEFDDVSQYLLTSWHSFDILQREKYNSEKYSLYEAHELRNKILKWNPK